MIFKPTVNLTIIVLLSMVINQYPQNFIKEKSLKSDFVKKENKILYYKNFENKIETSLSLSMENHSTDWIKAFKDAESILLKKDFIKQAINTVLNSEIDKNIKLQRMALEYAYGFYPNEFEEIVQNIFTKTNDKVSYAISVKYLTNLESNDKSVAFYLKDLEKRFRHYESDPILQSLEFDLKNPDSLKFKEIPNFEELLKSKFQSGKTIIYTFQRHNRKFPGITIIKKPNGDFVKNDDGTIFYIQQLALSFANLPEYIPNGNTPEGIYSVVGTYISPTESIGPTPNILVRSPLEVSPSIFYHKNNIHQKWNIDEYKNLLPKSWQNYFPILQSYLAGEIGRKLIIMHGSTDEIKYFEDEPYYPLTPTRGCLSAKEIWNDNTGVQIESDQVRLVNAFRKTHQNEGFLVVVEINDKQKPVELNEILPYLK